MTTDEYAPAAGKLFAQLLHEKAWEHLGMTGPEFIDAWYNGVFKDDPRPAVVAMNELMQTGRWDPSKIVEPAPVIEPSITLDA